MAAPLKAPDIVFEPMDLSETKVDNGAIPPSVSPPGLTRATPGDNKMDFGLADSDFDQLLGYCLFLCICLVNFVIIEINYH